MAEMDAAERLALIRENLAEVLNPEIIEKILNEGGHPKIYWGRCFLQAKPSHADRLVAQEPPPRAALTAATSCPP